MFFWSFLVYHFKAVTVKPKTKMSKWPKVKFKIIFFKEILFLFLKRILLEIYVSHKNSSNYPWFSPYVHYYSFFCTVSLKIINIIFIKIYQQKIALWKTWSKNCTCKTLLRLWCPFHCLVCFRHLQKVGTDFPLSSNVFKVKHLKTCLYFHH